MKHLKYFENNEELPKSIDIDTELKELRKLKKEKENIKTSDYNDIIDKIGSKEYNDIINKEDKIEKVIKEKLYPIMMKYINNTDFEGAKWFVGNSYKDVNTFGKVLLFRTILMHENEIIGKYNL